jgi:predicted metal-binding membrane protein
MSALSSTLTGAALGEADRCQHCAPPGSGTALRQAHQWPLFAILALLFIASTAATIAWCTSMSAMGEMSMPGGWTMSMMWMRMPGQTWLGAAASFLGMWLLMMVAMMLPSLAPMLLRYREAIGNSGEARQGRLTALVGVAYFLVWTAFGIAVFPLGVAVTGAEMQQPALAHVVPFVVAVVILISGAVQFTGWKTHQLVYCREGRSGCRPLVADAGTAFRQGLRLGLHCCYCCANLTAILMVSGIMELRAMAVVTAAITIERLAPASERAARAIGAVLVVAGLFLSARALALGWG